MDTKDIFTPQLKKIKCNTVVDFNVPDYMNKTWIVRFDNKIKREVDSYDLFRFSLFQEGGLTLGVGRYPTVFDFNSNLQFENFDTGEKLSKKGKLSKLLKKGFTSAIVDGRFKEHEGSWVMEFIYHDIKDNVDLPLSEDVEKEIRKHQLQHSLADS